MRRQEPFECDIYFYGVEGGESLGLSIDWRTIRARGVPGRSGIAVASPR